MATEITSPAFGAIPFAGADVDDEHRAALHEAILDRKWRHKNRQQVFGSRLMEKTVDKAGQDDAKRAARAAALNQKK